MLRRRPGTGGNRRPRGSYRRHSWCTPSPSPPGSASCRQCGRISGRTRQVKDVLQARQFVASSHSSSSSCGTARSFVVAEEPSLTHGAPASARLQNELARTTELAALRVVGRVIGEQHRPVVAGDAVGRRAKAPGARRAARLKRRVVLQDQSIVAPLAPSRS